MDPNYFNDRTLKEMTALIYVGQDTFNMLTGARVGLGDCGIVEGNHEYTSDEALSIIKKIDNASFSAPKYLQKRIRAIRMGFVFAFGPAMEQALGEF